MSEKMAKNVATMLNALGILVLLAAAFDIAAVADNILIFIGISCFILGGVARRLLK